ncbi:MAG: BMC domain-containing protein [Sedimentibacter sp.]
MFRALGIIEFSSIAKGIETADKMVKKATTEVLLLRHLCPGKFMVILSGDVEDVKEAVDTAVNGDRNKIIESAVISNAHEALILSFKKRLEKCEFESIGIFETATVTSALVSLDSALKSASVILVKLVIGNGIGGKSYFVVNGSVSSVEEAIKNATNSIHIKKLVHKTIIPSPDQDIINNL